MCGHENSSSGFQSGVLLTLIPPHLKTSSSQLVRGPPHPFGAELRSDEAGVRGLFSPFIAHYTHSDIPLFDHQHSNTVTSSSSCFESKQDRDRWIEDTLRSEFGQKRGVATSSLGVLAMPPSVSDVLSQSVTATMELEIGESCGAIREVRRVARNFESAQRCCTAPQLVGCCSIFCQIDSHHIESQRCR